MRRTLLSRGLPLLALAAGLALLAPAAAADDKEEGFKPLFNGKDFTGFKFVIGPKESEPGKTFTVTDGVIVVSGKPNGYFYTDKGYKNYVLRFDWKYADPKGGNSGCLVHIQPPHKTWPKCVEVQGLQSDHGHIFAISGAKGQFTVDKEAQKKAIKPGEWNTTEVISRDGELTAKVNGVEVSKGKGELTEGPIGWQSEGAEIHFKNIKIKEMK
ncbi:MAG TPA: DUF1080 domain-containing protein [Gemmataceae bacterium]|nr:DUF1080 domain-containing protein [Gemmataceae bacterium]